MKRLIGTNGLEKKEWLKYRKTGITGTDAGAICGLNPYVSAFQVYQDKITDEIEEKDNEAVSVPPTIYLKNTGKRFCTPIRLSALQSNGQNLPA